MGDNITKNYNLVSNLELGLIELVGLNEILPYILY